MLTIYVGLPGSGKSVSAAVAAMLHPWTILHDDFLEAGEVSDDLRGVPGLGADVRAGRTIHAADARLCLASYRGALARFLEEHAPRGYRIRWTFFSNSPVECRSNIEARYRREVARRPREAEAAAGRRLRALELIEALAPSYEIPPGEEARPVFDYQGGRPTTPGVPRD